MQEILIVSIKLGIPVFLLTWFMFSRLYRDQVISREHSRKSAEQELKQKHKSGDDKLNIGDKKDHFLLRNWMMLGGGFYGLSGLWTLIAVEFLDITRFLYNLPQFISNYDNGFLGLIIMFAINQLNNIVQAFMWFNFWSEKSLLYSLAVAYLGYLAGIAQAKRKSIYAYFEGE